MALPNIVGPVPQHLVKAGTAKLEAGATAAEVNPGRDAITISNMGTNVLYIALGPTTEADGMATTSEFHFALKACAGNDDGTGGTVKVDDFTGKISVAGTSPRYTVVEFMVG